MATLISLIRVSLLITSDQRPAEKLQPCCVKMCVFPQGALPAFVVEHLPEDFLVQILDKQMELFGSLLVKTR